MRKAGGAAHKVTDTAHEGLCPHTPVARRMPPSITICKLTPSLEGRTPTRNPSAIYPPTPSGQTGQTGTDRGVGDPRRRVPPVKPSPTVSPSIRLVWWDLGHGSPSRALECGHSHSQQVRRTPHFSAIFALGRAFEKLKFGVLDDSH
ncbi:uncharacterized protein CLUP02_18186 [Colletotrichum lupini]|uniref:Uncharacterized protein n=1 Tax=Colletotrichum lupini TaxID=145971 RepID=A0A9Q8WBI1_9PEZI|nr:uncharacterized protein CLUP02_18186 [Colletotrichum lupini]UQC76672.1 hypothetical protein CLUP02_18186 [Colletotrichum lupini]